MAPMNTLPVLGRAVYGSPLRDLKPPKSACDLIERTPRFLHPGNRE